MFSAKTEIIKFINDEEGLTVVEYVVGAGLLVVGFTGFFSDFADVLIAKMSSLMK
ncbi:hypothetical protein [Vibrio sp. 99-8-1]|uniref:Flp family type IVb pilin n=1 Tax=Vibrio sp. 99-8-1 TaxID=2607602 RepID=UPI001493D530|nr:hypothetical protein [Vibrio sp. 99-8-1]